LKTDQVLELVKDIGLVVAALDPKFEYLSRSFCILETFAAVAGNADLFCFTRNSSGNLVPFGGKDGLNSKCMNQPVNSSQAATRNAEDKAKIDRFIEGSCGFAELDKLVSRAILDGAADNGSNMCCGAYTKVGNALYFSTAGCCGIWCCIDNVLGLNYNNGCCCLAPKWDIVKTPNDQARPHCFRGDFEERCWYEVCGINCECFPYICTLSRNSGYTLDHPDNSQCGALWAQVRCQCELLQILPGAGNYCAMVTCCPLLPCLCAMHQCQVRDFAGQEKEKKKEEEEENPAEQIKRMAEVEMEVEMEEHWSQHRQDMEEMEEAQLVTPSLQCILNPLCLISSVLFSSSSFFLLSPRGGRTPQIRTI